jgi:hypothetical protein
LYIRPVVRQLVEAFNIPLVDVCATAVRYAPSHEIPLGFIKYTFEGSITALFRRHSQLIRAAFSGALTILDVTDFLDGRTITTYGYLAFGTDEVYLENRGCHCEDLLRHVPQLFAYTTFPHIPADPFLLTFTPVDENTPLVPT